MAGVGMAGALQTYGGMLLFRSLTLGLVGAMFWIQLDAKRENVVISPPPEVVAQTAGPTIVDVAPGVDQLAGLVRIKPGERVLSVDDRKVESDLEAGAAITAHDHPYVDIEVATAAGGSRRVLLLLH